MRYGVLVGGAGSVQHALRLVHWLSKAEDVWASKGYDGAEFIFACDEGVSTRNPGGGAFRNGWCLSMQTNIRDGQPLGISAALKTSSDSVNHTKVSDGKIFSRHSKFE